MPARIRTIDGVEIYDLIKSRDNVALAVKNACKDHAHDPAVIRIKENPEPYIDAVCEILENGEFHYSSFKFKTIFERGKWRHLCFTHTFPDRIIQHAVFQIVEPILLGTCIRDTYAAIKGRGLHRGVVQIQRDMEADPEGTMYCLKFDIRHYFDNIDRNLLFKMIKRKIKDPRTLEILHRIIFECPGEKGLPIGLFSSQILSAFYLSGFDHYCKERLGAPYYYRYADDIVLLYRNPAQLRRYLVFIRKYLAELGLEIKPNWQIFPVDSRGIDFMGYVFRHTHVRIRKRNKISYIRSCNRILYCLRHTEAITPTMIRSKSSYEGMLGWCDARHLVEVHTGRVDRALEFGLEAIA